MAHRPITYRRHAICFLACALLLVSACKRHDDIRTVSTYTLQNRMVDTLTVDLYPSVDDYNHCQNLISRVELAPGTSKALQLEPFKTYGLDWYSADYKYSNWVEPMMHSAGGSFPDLSTPAPLQVALEDDQRVLSTDKPDISRLILLKGNEPSSTWKAIVKAPGAHIGTHIIRLGKDFRWVDSVTDGNYTVMYRGTFESHNGAYPEFVAMLYTEEQNIYGALSFGSPFGASNRDTLMLSFIDPGLASFDTAIRQ